VQRAREERRVGKEWRSPRPQAIQSPKSSAASSAAKKAPKAEEKS